MTFTEKERAYAAGLIDGEGCIRVSKRTQHYHKNPSVQFSMVVQVNATSEAMIDWLHSRWGGSKRHIAAPAQANRRPQWTWQITSQQAATFLEDIYPFLVVKKEQAMFARSFQAMRRRWGQGGMPDGVRQMQGMVFDKMRQLNQRGLPAATTS